MYPIALIALVIISVATRMIDIDTYPPGFSGHAIAHALYRKRIYDLLFVTPWTPESLQILKGVAIKEHHGPQSLLEAILTPLFGFGFSQSRMLVSTLGLGSIALAVMWGAAAVSRWFGLAVGLAIAVAPFHLTFSRNGDSEHINIFLHGFLLLFAAQRTISSGRWYDSALLGTSAALSLYVYATNQFLCGLVLPLVIFVRLLDYRSITLKSAALHLTCFALPAAVIARPLVSHYLQWGRSVPIRTPYGSSLYDVSPLALLPEQLLAAWNELFYRGTDGWFARPHGALNDDSIFLLIPGLVTLIVLLFRSRAQCRAAPEDSSALRSYRSILLAALATAACIILGSLPGVLSPKPVFRRMALIGLGIEIMKGVGIFGLGALLVRYLPRLLAVPLCATLLALLAQLEWRAFRYDVTVSESSSLFTQVSLAREALKHIAANSEIRILLPSTPGFVGREELAQLLSFNLNYPQQLPAAYRPLDWGDLAPTGAQRVYLPIFTYRKIQAGEAPLPASIRMVNDAIVSEDSMDAFAIADFVSQ